MPWHAEGIPQVESILASTGQTRRNHSHSHNHKHNHRRPTSPTCAEAAGLGADAGMFAGPFQSLLDRGNTEPLNIDLDGGAPPTGQRRGGRVRRSPPASLRLHCSESAPARDWPSPSHPELFAKELISRIESLWAMGSVQFSVAPHTASRPYATSSAEGVVPADLYMWHDPNTAATLSIRLIPVTPVEHGGAWWYRASASSVHHHGSSVSLYVLLPGVSSMHPRAHRYPYGGQEVRFLPCVHAGAVEEMWEDDGGGGGGGPPWCGDTGTRSEYSVYRVTRGGAVMVEAGGWAIPASCLQGVGGGRGCAACGGARQCKHLRLAAACIRGSDVAALAEVLHAELAKADSSLGVGECLSSEASGSSGGATPPQLALDPMSCGGCRAERRGPPLCPICKQATADIAQHVVDVHWRAATAAPHAVHAMATKRGQCDAQWLGL